MKATETGGQLLCIPRAQIYIPRVIGNKGYTVNMKVLPEVSDSKSADYPDENIIGRSFPIKSYSHSGNRQIGWKCHFVVTQFSDILENYQNLRAIQSAVYPDDDPSVAANVPYIPPPICKIRLGSLLVGPGGGLAGTGAEACNGKATGTTEWLSVVLRQYSCSFPTEVAWDEDTYLPYRFDVDLNWEVVYTNTNLPGQQRIFKG